MRVYLDNCCYNRPFDDQFQPRIALETQAKMYVQSLIKKGEIELATSFMLKYENSKNSYIKKKNIIDSFMNDYSDVYIGKQLEERLSQMVDEIEATGVKSADATHIACAILAECDYMLTTDDRLLRYKNEKIKIVNPTEFVAITGGIKNE